MQDCFQSHAWGIDSLEGTGDVSSEDAPCPSDDLDPCVPARYVARTIVTSGLEVKRMALVKAI